MLHDHAVFVSKLWNFWEVDGVGGLTALACSQVASAEQKSPLQHQSRRRGDRAWVTTAPCWMKKAANPRLV